MSEPAPLGINVTENIKAADRMGSAPRLTLTEEQWLALQDYLKAFNVHMTILKYEPFVVQLTDRTKTP